MHCWQNWPLALTCAQLAKVIVFWLEVEEVPEFVVAIVEVIVFEEPLDIYIVFLSTIYMQIFPFSL